MNFELTTEERRAWLQARDIQVFGRLYVHHLRDALTKTLARAMKAEFEAEHFEVQTKDSVPGKRQFICLACNYTDERHTMRLEDWLAAAERELEEK